MNWVWEQFQTKGEWLFKFILLNLMWIVFTLLGGVIFGFFPATVSLFSVIRKWIKGEQDVNTTQHFITTYKNSFIQSNILGLIILATGVFLAVDLYVSQKMIGNLFIHLLLLFIILLFSLSVLFFFPTFVHYELNIFSYIRQTFFMIFIRPLYSLAAIGTFCIIVTAFYIFPVLTVFFAGPMMAYPLMWIGNKVFGALENHKQHTPKKMTYS